VVPGDRGARLVFPIVLVPAQPQIEAEVAVEPPDVIREDRISPIAAALRQLEDRSPADNRAGGKDRKELFAADDGSSGQDLVSAARLPGVCPLTVVENVEATHEVMRAHARSREEVRGLHDDVLVPLPLASQLALRNVADSAAVGGVPDGVLTRPQTDGRTPHEIREARAPAYIGLLPPGVLA